MERRREPRFPCLRPAKITLLQGEQLSHSAQMQNICGRGARLLVRSPLPVGLPVRIDAEDLLLLGDVCYCQQEETQLFSVGVAVAHSISNLRELAALARALRDEPVEVTANESS
ncbi:MAG: PilZ domain-containing protein [Bryobacteraceae bacterium]|nr:PilZ domain-containing protein [Bryobacteraceae bacterium]MDW8380437.1 PilZ domain-containing protein [Bryobacterales bacterium]